MNIVAFCVLGIFLCGYVILDGYDLGMGSIVLFVSRTEDERRAALATIAPFWNGNEVWLIAGGASLFAFFPQVYASAFSGFYLPFILVLWLLMGRGIAFEIREMVEEPLWHAFWDVVFALSSTGLIVLFGITLGNIVRGVPLGHNAYFLGLFGFLLNPYALGVGVLALVALALHGSTYVAMHTDGAVRERCRRGIVPLFAILVVCYVVVTAATFAVRSPATYGPVPAIAVGGCIAIGALVALYVGIRRRREHAAFVASSVFLAGLLLSAAATTYPYLLPGFPDPTTGLDIFRFAPPSFALTSALVATIVGLILLAAYRTAVARLLRR